MRKPNPELLAAVRHAASPEGMAEAEVRRQREAEDAARLRVVEPAPVVDPRTFEIERAAHDARLAKWNEEAENRLAKARKSMTTRGLRAGHYWLRAANGDGFYVAELIDDVYLSCGPEWYVVGSEVPRDIDDITDAEIVCRLDPPDA